MAVFLQLAQEENIKLYLFGVLHASPICRARYLSRIADMFCNSGPPIFIAVEAAPGLFYDVVLPQRNKFRELAMTDTEFTRHDVSFVDALSKCIGFEADAHKHIYGTEEPLIIWLDEHRDKEQDDQGCARSLGKNYYQWFKNYLKQQPCATMEEAFQCIHSGLMAYTPKYHETDEHLYRRDHRWSEMIRTKFRECTDCTYAIVIVGLEHIKSNPLSILSRLSETITCEAIDITEA